MLPMLLPNPSTVTVFPVLTKTAHSLPTAVVSAWLSNSILECVLSRYGGSPGSKAWDLFLFLLLAADRSLALGNLQEVTESMDLLSCLEAFLLLP